MGDILVVEDSVDLRELLVLLLRDEGHQVVAVPSVPEAVSWLGRQLFRLVITDLSYQDPDGPAEEDRVWLAQATGHAPVLVLTGRSWAPRMTATDLGVAGLLIKPFDVEELLVSVRQLLLS